MSYSNGGAGAGTGAGRVNNNNTSYSDPHEQEAPTTSSTSSTAAAAATSNRSEAASAELKLYQAFIFSVPIFFTFVLLLFFYLFYLRRRRVDWASLRMRTSSSYVSSQSDDDTSTSSSSRVEMRCGLKKEVREMLPIIVFKESFSIKDTQCSVCLGDYQSEERLQQIPACGHTFHMDCIDSWLSKHATCPLCRQSLLVSAKTSSEASDVQLGGNNISSNAQNGGNVAPENGYHPAEDSSQDNRFCSSNERIITSRGEEEEIGAHNADTDREMRSNNEH